MKKIALVVAMLALVTPVMATTNAVIDACDLGSGNVAIIYNVTGGDVSGFGLDITVDSGTIDAIGGYKIGESNSTSKGYGIFPGTIDINDTTGMVDSYGNPVAPSSDPGALGGLGTGGITIELGAQYTTGNAPNRAGTICTVTVSSSCNITVALNTTRGGVVDVNYLDATTPGLPRTRHVTKASYFDWGDAPDPTFPTLLASGGASHQMSGPNAGLGPILGALIDAEADGQPDAIATGDDIAGLDDEDGIVSLNVLGGTVRLTVSAACKLNAWIDFTNDGDWTDANEQVFFTSPSRTSNLALGAAGTYNLTFYVPGGSAYNAVVSRWRVSTAGNLPYTGQAADGEVEDYKECLRNTAPGYARWVAYGRPNCWCYWKQCRGDFNGAALAGIRVTIADLNGLIAAYLQANPASICADFNHAELAGIDVTLADLNILIPNYLGAEAGVPCGCSALRGPYNMYVGVIPPTPVPCN